MNTTHKMMIKSLPLCLSTALLLAAAALPSHASSIYWTNTGGGNWNNAANWNPNQVPGPDDTAFITIAADYSVTLDVSPTVAGLVLGAGGSSHTQSLFMAEQTLSVSGQIQVNAQGQFNFDGGTITATMTVASNGVLNMASGGANDLLAGFVLTNYGTVNWTNTPVYGWNGQNGQIYNYGLWNEQSDDYFDGAYQGGPPTIFDNFGTFLKSGNTGATTLDGNVVFNNTGTVNVGSGTLDIVGGGTNSGGNFTTVNDGIVNFASPEYYFTNTTTFTGSGSFMSGSETFGGSMVGTLTWNGGYLSGVMTVASNGVLNIASGGLNDYLEGFVLTNYGTVIWTNTPLYGWNGQNAQIYNYGLWNEQSDDLFDGAYQGGPPTIFENFGTFLKSGNAGATTLDGNVVFNNTATVNVQSGTLVIAAGTSSGGDFSTANAANINFYGYVFTNSTTFIGIGSFVPNGATFGGTIAGALTWNGGYLSGVMTVASNGVLNIASGGVNDYLEGLVLTNYGTVIWTNTPLYGWNAQNAQIYNYGLWNEQSDDLFDGAYQGGPPTVFNNFGTFRKSGNTGATTLDGNVVFNNTGVLDAESGTLSLVNYNLAGGIMNFGISSLTNYGQVYLSADPSTLDGSITAQLNNGYVPAVSDVFQPLSYPSFAGNFTHTNLPSLAIWQTTYGSTALSITVLKLVPRLTWTNPANIVYGTLLSGAQLNATAASPANLSGTLAGTFNYNPPLGTKLFASNNQTLSVTFTPSDLVNYTNVTISVKISVLQAPLTIASGIAANNKVYDRTTTATLNSNNVVFSGVVTGDTLSLNTNGYTASFAGAGVGNGIAVTVGGLALSGAAAANYTLAQPSSLTAKITPAGVTIASGISANNKVYNRSTTAMLNSNNVVLAGVVMGDMLSLNTNGYLANFASAGVGNGIAMTVTGLTLTGASNADYTLTQPASLTANITPAMVTISSGITANNKVYSRTTTATLNSNSVVLTGVVAGDTLTLNTSGYTADFATAGVGSGIAVTVTGLSLSGAGAADYSLTQPTGLTASITVPSLQILSSLPNIVLSWPTNASVFVLNGTPSLASTTTWTPVTSGVTVSGTNNTFTTNSGSGNQYYKLIAP